MATVEVTLTDGSTRTGIPSLVSSNTAVATVSGTLVNALSPGTSIITATYASATSLFTVFVLSTQASIVSMSLFYTSNTLSGQRGTTSTGSLSVSFNDGTFFSNVISLFSPQFTSIVSFSSSDPDSVSVTAAGVASLVNNSWRLAVLTVSFLTYYNLILILVMYPPYIYQL